jgi:hypothetical protein
MRPDKSACVEQAVVVKVFELIGGFSLLHAS